MSDATNPRAISLLRGAKRSIRRIVEDLDSYVVIVAAIGFTAAAAAGVNLDSTLPSLTVAMLALISLSLVRTRYRVVSKRALSPSDVLAWRDNVIDIGRLIQESEDVWLWGAAQTAYIPMLRMPLGRAVGRGLRVKVILVEPGSASLRMLAVRAVSPPSDPRDATSVGQYIDRLNQMAESLDRQLATSIEYLDEIRRAVPGNKLEYRTIDYLGPYVIYAFDPKTPHGKLIVRLAFHDGNNDERATLFLDKQTDSAWFEHFMHQIETIWSAASTIAAAGGWSANWPAAREGSPNF
jgi:hypothetical protein